MTSANPYSPPTTSGADSGNATSPSTRRLWIAYAIAPPVAPLLAAVTAFITGAVYQASHPEDVEVNPMSLVFLPIAIMILGIPASYGVAGVVGMPIAFALRRRDRLNGLTVHGAALLAAGILTLVLMIVGLLSAWNQSELSSESGILEVLVGTGLTFLVLTPFILLTATAFWLIGVRRWNRSRALNEPVPDG